MKNYLIIALFFCFWTATSQFTLTGKVMDENGLPLYGSHVHSIYFNTTTDESGIFEIKHLPKAEIRIYISNLGYSSVDTIIDIHQDKFVTFQLMTETSALDEVVIQQHLNQRHKVSNQIVSEEYIQDQFAGSLAITLERLPGINATEIGAGASKPIIRGLGFNRVVVAENSIKHEGQQWGADHGLEIDAFAAEEIEVIKSGGMIEYGSDAIGGIINIRNDLIPNKNSFSGKYTVMGRSVNQTLLNSIHVQGRKDRLFYKFKATISDYGDYNVPTDNIVYLTVNMPVYNNRLKNTAGNEQNFFGQVGYVADNFHSIFTASNTYTKAGFFPGSHGIPSISRVEDDGDRRNIDYPYQSVNHFKLTSTNRWLFERSDITFSSNFQNNRRREFSEFHTHFGSQAPPLENPDVELDFNLNTFDNQLKYSQFLSSKSKFNLGVQHQYQENKIDGYNFLLPAYTRKTLAAFASYEHQATEKLILDFGMRFDFAAIKTESFYDLNLYEFLISMGQTEERAQFYALRSSEIDRDFQNVNALSSLIYTPSQNWEYTLSVGTNFRVPNAIELASNGIHHGSFRHEQGDPSLSPERGIVADATMGYRNETFSVGLSPFLFYFQNYIFLMPSGTFSPLPHGGQVYRYTESEAFITGVEIQLDKTWFERLNSLFIFEYLYSRQITGSNSRNYPLPFSPPVNGFLELGYQFGTIGKRLQETTLSLNSKFALEQNRTAQNERVTPGYAIYGFGLKTNFVVNSFKAEVSLQGTNLFNTRYFNHTNFYRALEIPEMGRNFQLMIKIPFGESNG
jgi:iron complex outermembrane recepter protein